MGTGASVEEREVLKTSIYSAAATVLQKMDGDGDVEEEGEDEEGEFPRILISHYMRGKRPKEEVAKAILTWAQKKMEDGDSTEKDIWKDAMRGIHNRSRKNFPKVLDLLYETLGKTSPELIWTIGVQVSSQDNNEVFAKAVLESLPEVTVIQDAELLMEVYPGLVEYYANQAWCRDFWHKEVLPRANDAILEELKKKDENGKPKVIAEHVDCGYIFSCAEMIRLGGDYAGAMRDADAEELVKLHQQAEVYGSAWPFHLELIKAIGSGNMEGMSGFLDKANLNETFVDGDAKSVSLLVLSMQKCWDQRWSECLLEYQGLTVEHAKCVWLPYDDLTIFKMLLAHPNLDPNTGAHSYGWHGSHVRVTPLGMALLDELDTGSGYHSLEGDSRLVASRRDIVELLANDPRVDLEDVYMENFEEGDPAWFSALAHLECKNFGPVDYAAGMILMKAGALMSPGWVMMLENLDKGLQKQFLEEELAEEQEKEQTPPETLETTMLKPYTLVPAMSHHHRYNKTQVIKSRLADLEEVKEWYHIVRMGSNVFNSPKSFPPNYCRAAHAIKKAFRTLGRASVGKILDFLPFFEFNRRRVPRSQFHKQIDNFGRPLSRVAFEMQQLDKRIRNWILKEDGEEVEEESEQTGFEIFSEFNETCWAQDTSVRLFEESKAGGDGGDECDE